MPAQPADKPWIERVVANPALRSGYASLVAHVLVCILLALFASMPEARPRPRPLVLRMGTADAAGAAEEPTPQVEIAAANDREAAAEIVADAAIATVVPEPAAQQPLAAADPSAAAADVPLVAIDAAEVGAAVAGPQPDPTAASATSTTQTVSVRIEPAQGRPRVAGGVGGRPFAARRGNERREAVRSRGGSAESEAAVERGLAWLALHQAVDGSWQFDLSGCRCDGGCRDPGTLESSTASTAIALLPFLGAGSTHLDGPYQGTVSRGIYYLVSRMQPTPRGGDFCEGTMYGHGVTTLVLAEALGMTKDDMLVPYVRDAVRFIETAQDMHGGGWRYLPGQAGDTTVTAWQLAALKSAALAGLETPSPTIDGVRRFLDRVQTQKGAAYGYRTPAAKPCTSAIGLLCRMYTGWGSTQEPLQRGITNLAKPGPAPHAIYQNFYLSQALLQLDHPVWPRWNAKNREQLIAQQARFGHETGSWFFADPDTSPGGRLTHTALAVLTLEVYYRLLPIYGAAAVEGGF
jgi:hypothetical protein